MLRDLGQMVAEAEKLGPVAAVTAPPSPLPQPSRAAPARAGADGRALAVRHPRGRPGATRRRVAVEDELATREVVRPLPATAFVAPSGAGAARPDEGPQGGLGRLAARRADPFEEGLARRRLPSPSRDGRIADVDASLPGARGGPSRPATRPRGLAVSAARRRPVGPRAVRRPPGRGHGDHPGRRAGGLRARSGRRDRPADGDPDGRSRLPLPSRRPRRRLRPAGPGTLDRPTEILSAIPPPAPAPRLPLPPVPPTAGFVDRPTEILQAIPRPGRRPSGTRTAGPASRRPAASTGAPDPPRRPGPTGRPRSSGARSRPRRSVPAAPPLPPTTSARRARPSGSSTR